MDSLGRECAGTILFTTFAQILIEHSPNLFFVINKGILLSERLSVGLTLLNRFFKLFDCSQLF